MDETTEESVALKVLSLDAKKYSRRFLREAKVMAELSHPNIVRYVDYGETDRGAPYIVMEWVRGEDLRQRMNRKKLELSEALDVVAGTGEALAFAHSRGVIHRDLKPSNLMLVGGDIRHLKLLDFGIARWRGPAVEKMTQTGISIGTPGYMAPEQSRGDSVIDGRADLYALGCVIFECLVGKRPFQGEDVTKMLARTAHDEPPRVSESRKDISKAFDDLLADMMAPNVERRPIDGNVMAARARVTEASAMSSTMIEPPEIGLSICEKELISVILLDAVHTKNVSHENVLSEKEIDLAIAEEARRVGGDTRRLDDGSVLVTCQDPRGSASDMTVRAVRCALAARALRPQTKIAIATGLGEVATLSSNSRLMIRVMQLRSTAEAPPGPRSRALSIRVDDSTFRLLDGRFDIRRRRDDPNRGFDLLGSEPQAHSTEVPSGAPPCYGRESEVSEICEQFQGCLAENRPSTVLLLGEAGIGKSRLCGEVFTRLREQHEGIKIWSARGDTHGEPIAFGLLGQILHQACGISKTDAVAERRQKILQRTRKYVNEERAQHLAEFLGELCETPFPAESSRGTLHAARGNTVLMGTQMRSAWEEFISAASKTHPLLLVVEDAHGADLPTLRLLESSLRGAEAGGWMVIAIARPELTTLFPAVWKGKEINRIHLEGLTKEACEEMLLSLLGHAPSRGTVDRLVKLSGGNPLYLEELLRSIKLRQGLQVSDTVLALTMFKLNPLGPRVRRVLRAASLFGASFTLEGLRTLLGKTPAIEDLESVLAELVENHTIEVRDEPGITEHNYYFFCDELVREAAYNTLTRIDLRQGHHNVGVWLHDNGVRDGLMLARHFHIARDVQQAGLWYEHAAKEALDADDMADAMNRAQRGISTGAKGIVLGKLHSTMAAALLWTGDNSKAGEHSLLALDYLEEEPLRWAVAAGDAATALGRCGAYVDVQSIAQRLIESKGEDGFEGPAVGALARSALQILYSGEYSDAAAILERLPPEANILAETDPAAHGHLLLALANRSLYSGDLSSHLRLSHGSAAHFQSFGDKRSAALAQISVGFSYGQLGDYASAERVLRDSLDVAGDLDLGSIDSLARVNLAQILLATGEYSEAWDLALVAIESFQMQGDDRMANRSRVCLSRVHQRQGSLDSAETEAREALHGTNTAATIRMHAHAQLASVLLDLARPKEALESAKEAGAIMRAVGQVGEAESFVRIVAVECQLRCEHRTEARAALASAHASLLDRFNRIEDPSLRLSFVEQVEENARTVQLATEWGVNGEG
jgi:tetratricopeptide (TPR) repeat protein